MKIVKNFFVIWLLGRIQKYNAKQYWDMRDKVLNIEYNNIFLKCYYLYKIKKMDAFNNASFGTNINSGATFKTTPILPHGLNGIIIGHDCIVGENVTIFQQVTIAHGGVVIGNNVLIGAGAKILPYVTISNNVKIGANCVVNEDIPFGSTVVLPKSIIINNA